MRPPNIVGEKLTFRELLISAVLGNPSLSYSGSPEELAYNAISIADAVLKELKSAAYHTTDKSFPALKVPPPVPVESENPTRPVTPRSITEDRLKAIAMDDVEPDEADWEAETRYVIVEPRALKKPTK